MSAAQEHHEEDVLARFDTGLLRRLLAFAIPHRRLFYASFAVLALGFLCELIGPLIVRLALDGPIAAYQAGAIAWRTASFQFGGHVLVYALLVALIGWVRYGEIVLMARTGQSVILDIRTKLFEHLQRLSLSFYDRNPSGRLVTRTTSDVETLNELFTSGVVMMARDLIKIVFILAWLYTIHARLALVVTIFVPILAGISLVFRNKARTSFHIVRGKNARLNGYLTETINGMRVVQLFGQEPKTGGRFAELCQDYFRANLRTIFFFALFYPLVELLIYVLEGTVIWGAAGGLGSIIITRGELLQFWLTMQILVNPIRELGEKYNVLQAAMASSERIFRVLDTQPEIRALERPRESADPGVEASGAIEFREVSFGYDAASPVLQNLSFRAAAGQKVAIVGATGAGKSTIISLLARFYDVDSGAVLLDGCDVRELDPPELRQRIALVPQDVFLFTGTIAENISLGRPGIGREEVIHAAEAVCAARFIKRLPGGYDAPVAERGATFSMGERQLLAFARALAGEPRIIVLDEATAHIDTETEAWIEEGIEQLMKGRTSVVIAHRLSTITSADQILVLHRGVLREAGTHAELLQSGGIYSKLYRLQFQ